MKKFSSFITEARMTTVGEITAAIAGHKKAGEILNPQYQDLGSQARRVFGGDTKHARDLMLKHFHAGDKTPELNDLYYSWPSDSFASLNKAAKLLAKVKGPQYKDVIAASNQVVKTWQPIAADLKDLKGKVVKVTQKRAEAKQAAQKVMSGKKASSAPLIKIFESHMNEYIAMAEKRAKAFVDDKLDTLKKHGMDLDKVAPPPNSRTMGASEYKTAQAKRDLYRSITKSTKNMLSRGEPDIREPNKVMIDRYIEMNKKGAEDAYRNFMEKMIQKIGKPVVDAKMTGNIWTNAVLTVTTDDNEEQVWHTQMILNFSKYQKMFNQFPSRRKK
jgi:hypothetical protein